MLHVGNVWIFTTCEVTYWEDLRLRTKAKLKDGSSLLVKLRAGKVYTSPNQGKIKSQFCSVKKRYMVRTLLYNMYNNIYFFFDFHTRVIFKYIHTQYFIRELFHMYDNKAKEEKN